MLFISKPCHLNLCKHVPSRLHHGASCTTMCFLNATLADFYTTMYAKQQKLIL